jgi:nucleoside-diphosphate-sugar epimerase
MSASQNNKLHFLLLGATGGTGRHFLTKALSDGHKVRALVRTPFKIPSTTSSHPNLEIITGSITDTTNTDQLVSGIDCVISMLGDQKAQQTAKINTAFIKQLIPSMRKQGVKKILYQAGGLSKPYNGELSWPLWVVRKTIARGFNGQHEDNESVMEYFATECMDIDWIVHRAGIYGDGPSKGRLERSQKSPSIATFGDCADYSYRLVWDEKAVRTSDFSQYVK